MKKMCMIVVCVLLLMCSVPAWADEVILPHPGYFFGREFNGFIIYFDEYPKDEYDVYVSLLTEQYGMEITDEQNLSFGEYVYLKKPDTDDDQVIVMCCKTYNQEEDRYEYGIRFNFSEDVTLSAMETYSPAKQGNTITTNDGLTVLSPEQYLGIAPCDEIRADDDRYGYVYTDRGYTYHGSGTANPVDWYRMEEYVNALVASGYYEIMEQSSDTDDAYWSLRYIGPAKVKRTFDLYYGMSDQAAITLRNFIGNIKVYYSRDILTADIDETQQRLGTYYVDTSKNTSSGNLSGDRCTVCGGDGKCDECGGSVWYNDFDFVYVNGAPELQYVRKMCADANCDFGSCYACGGDGLR